MEITVDSTLYHACPPPQNSYYMATIRRFLALTDSYLGLHFRGNIVSPLSITRLLFCLSSLHLFLCPEPLFLAFPFSLVYLEDTGVLI
jgi:hypothetical protein